MPGSRWLTATTAVVVSTALATAACGGGGGAKKSAALSAVGAGATTTTMAPMGDAAGGSAASTTAPMLAMTDDAPAVAAPSRATAGETAGVPVTTVPGGSAVQRQTQVGLRAGSVDDNDKFEDYLSYRKSFAALGIQVHDVDVSERHIFTVTGSTGRPVLGAHITVQSEQGAPATELRTYADGRAFFFPKAGRPANAPRYTATVEKSGVTKDVSFARTDTAHAVTLDVVPPTGAVKLDVQFLVDATGSMGDE